MTRDEAIKQIQGMVVGAEWLSDYQLEALDMAIEALENECMNVQCVDMKYRKE